jgi:RHS repeat-associated protein
LTYTGREDDQTGLLYYRTRYYDPEAEIFISQDPLGDAQRYVGGNPLSFTDPLGLWALGVQAGVSGEVGVGSGAAGSASVGYGFFSGSNSTAAFASTGGFVNMPGCKISQFAERRERPFRGGYRSSHPNFALGAYGGGGLAIFWSPNANRVSDILGSADSTTVEVGIGAPLNASVQRSISPSSGIEAYSIGLPKFPGYGLGVGISTYRSNTEQVKKWW